MENRSCEDQAGEESLTVFLDREAALRLSVAIVTCAVEDHRELSSIGAITTDGQVSKLWLEGDGVHLIRKAVSGSYRFKRDVESLLEFFHANGCCDHWVERCGLPIGPGSVQRKLREPHTQHFSKACYPPKE